jgi:Tfp pilus assembly protein PilN
MKDLLEIVIYKNGLRLCHPTDNSVFEFIPKEEGSVAEKIAVFIRTISAPAGTVHVFVAEELLFFKSFQLPGDTLNLKEAVGFQMEMLTPFDDTTWHTFHSTREEGAHQITLFAARSEFIDVYIQEIIDAGYMVSGLYPENQRFVNRMNRKTPWALLLPGKFQKAYIFNGTDLKERLLCSTEPTYSEAVELCRTGTIFKLEENRRDAALGDIRMPAETPYEDFIDARILLRETPLLKYFNMLPESYRRPDYAKIVIAVLLVLNIITFLSLGAVKAYRLKELNAQYDRKIEEIMPLVKEMKEIRIQEEESLQSIDRFKEIGGNFDLISLLTELTDELPKSSYVDQMRMDNRNNSIHIQGYTNDINELTANLQNVGNAQLKSTSSRRNKTYFHVEITLP